MENRYFIQDVYVPSGSRTIEHNLAKVVEPYVDHILSADQAKQFFSVYWNDGTHAMTKGKENKVIMLLHAVKVTDSATSPFASIEKTLLELPPGLHATSMIPIMNKGDK